MHKYLASIFDQNIDIHLIVVSAESIIAMPGTLCYYFCNCNNIFPAKDAVVLENELDELEVYGNVEAPSGEDKFLKYAFQVRFGAICAVMYDVL